MTKAQVFFTIQRGHSFRFRPHKLPSRKLRRLDLIAGKIPFMQTEQLGLGDLPATNW